MRTFPDESLQSDDLEGSANKFTMLSTLETFGNQTDAVKIVDQPD